MQRFELIFKTICALLYTNVAIYSGERPACWPLPPLGLDPLCDGPQSRTLEVNMGEQQLLNRWID